MEKIRIVVGGQLEKNTIAALIEKVGGERVTVEIMGDLNGAMALKNGKADYYFGCCNTGGGGSLAMAIALNGMAKCATVAFSGKILTEQQIADCIVAGKVAFGFVPESMDYAVKTIMSNILK